MRATAVGPDLSRAIIRFEQPQQRPAEPAPEEPEVEHPVETDGAEETTGLPLSA